MIKSEKQINLNIPVAKKRSRQARRNKQSSRRGSAVIECAMTAPLLIVILFGTIDVGQFVNISQSVSNASRIGGRAASRQDTVTATAVQTKVKDYLFACGIPRDGVTVTVSNSAGQTISNLTTVPSGSAINVRVSVSYASSRFIRFLPDLANAANTSTTTMRRE